MTWFYLIRCLPRWSLHDLVLSHSLSTLLVSPFMTWFYLIRCLLHWSLHDLVLSHSLPRWSLHDLVLSHSLPTSLVSSFMTWFCLILCLPLRLSCSHCFCFTRSKQSCTCIPDEEFLSCLGLSIMSCCFDLTSS